MWNPISPPTRLVSRRPRTVRSRRPRLETLESRVVLSVAFDSVIAVGNDMVGIQPWDNAVDSAGNTYVTGFFDGEMDFDPSVERPDGSDVLTPRGSRDAFVAKYNPDNTLAWVQRMGSDTISTFGVDPSEWGFAIAVDAAGHAYVTGQFLGQADFGPFTLTSAGSADAFIAKLGPDGDFLWARRLGGAGREYGTGIAVDTAGNVFAVATSYQNTNISYSNTHSFHVTKYSSSGTTVWSHEFRGSHSNLSANSVATDGGGNAYIHGNFIGTVDFDPHPKRPIRSPARWNCWATATS